MPRQPPTPLAVARTPGIVQGCLECDEAVMARLDEPVLLMEDRHAAGVFGFGEDEERVFDGGARLGATVGGGGRRKHSATWRLRERTKTFNVGLIVCLNIGE